MNAPTIDANHFRRACGQWATGVSIVTTADPDGKPYGLTMNAVSSLSLDPPMFLVCVDKNSDTREPMLAGGNFCVNVLTTEQQDLSNRFAKKGDDKFVDVEWEVSASGAPRLASTLMSIACEVSEVFSGGDHDIICGTVCEIVQSTHAQAKPLLYYGGGYGAIAD